MIINAILTGSVDNHLENERGSDCGQLDRVRKRLITINGGAFQQAAGGRGSLTAIAAAIVVFSVMASKT